MADLSGAAARVLGLPAEDYRERDERVGHARQLRHLSRLRAARRRGPAGRVRSIGHNTLVLHSHDQFTTRDLQRAGPWFIMDRCRTRSRGSVCHPWTGYREAFLRQRVAHTELQAGLRVGFTRSKVPSFMGGPRVRG